MVIENCGARIARSRPPGGSSRRLSMGMNVSYAEKEPRRAEVDALEGPTLLEFGSPWDGREVERLVRPADAGAVQAALKKID